MTMFGDIFVKNSEDNCFMSTGILSAVTTTPTDVWEIKNPNTAKSAHILGLWMLVAGACILTTLDVGYLIKRSTAASGGTPSADDICAMNSTNQGNQSMVVTAFTTNPTTGTLVKKVSTHQFTTYTSNGGYNFSPVSRIELYRAPSVAEALKLKANTTEALVFNLNGVTITSGSSPKLAFTCLWKEV